MMIKSEEAFLEEFAANLQIIEPIVTNEISRSFNHEPIRINKFPFFNQPFVCRFSNSNPEYISVEELLKIFIERWKQEINYQQKIMQIKDEMIKCFDQIVDSFADEETYKILQEEKEYTIEQIFMRTEIDRKQKAGEFCKGLVNGFEIEMLSKFDDIANYVLLIPFETPLPIGLIAYIQQIIRNEREKINIESIKKIGFNARSFISDHFEMVELDISNYTSVKAFKKAVQDVVLMKGKRCSIKIGKLDYDKLNLNTGNLNLSRIKLKMSTQEFVETNITFSYHELELNEWNKNVKADNLIQKLPKALKSLHLIVSNDQNENINAIKILMQGIRKINQEIKLALILKTLKIKNAEKLKSLVLQTPDQINIIINDLGYVLTNNSYQEISLLTGALRSQTEMKKLSLDFRIPQSQFQVKC